jgi:integrase/recombinase XerD
MKPLKKAARDYVALRRSLGFKLEWVPNSLADFVRFLEKQRADYITVPLALEWAQRNQEVKPITAAGRLSVVRSFARYRSATDPRTQIPPLGLLGCRSRRVPPYLYTDAETQSLLKAARQMPGLHGLTYYCLLGLLSVTGLRISEALSLRAQDVDLEQRMLTIVATKFGKSRLVPIHSSTAEELTKYARERDRVFRRNLIYFFVTRRGNRFTAGAIRHVFHRLSRQIGLRSPNASHGPRLHDFRHSFAVKTLVNWYRSGEKVEQCLPVLSTYLGHRNVTDTYWYLTACPELLGLAVTRFERHWEGTR